MPISEGGAMGPRYEANFDRALHRCQAEWENKTEETNDFETEDDIPTGEDEDG